MVLAVYALNGLLLFSCLLEKKTLEADRRFSYMLLRMLICLPSLAAGYAFLNVYPSQGGAIALFFSEIILAVVLLLTAHRLRCLLHPAAGMPAHHRILLAVALSVTLMGITWPFQPPAFEMGANEWVLPYFGQLYAFALFVLASMLVLAWRLESFWRSLAPGERWRFKYLMVGAFLIAGSMIWATSYRLTYLRIVPNHLLLLSILLMLAWLLIIYAVARHRLLNRRIFISRKIVYSAVAPTVFAGYLILLGLVSLFIKRFGWSLPFVLQWLLIVLGLVAIIMLALFPNVRGHIKYFISTHFYINKYEYRDQWLEFSELLQGKLSEKDVVEALGAILTKSLYTRKIMIWLGDDDSEFRLCSPDANTATDRDALAADGPLVAYMRHASYLSLQATEKEASTHLIIQDQKGFFEAHGLVLMASLSIGGHLMGLIGLGPEYTGGRYGRDDFDLLAALGSQAASALLAARTAERLAHAREQSAWDTLSAFVLHDIKNAATMLGLVQQNAPRHIHDPDFQQDMLASIEDALKRMDKVQARLKTFQGELVPVVVSFSLHDFLTVCLRRMSRKLPDLTVTLRGVQSISLLSDPEILNQIMENLLLNAMEAGATHVSAAVFMAGTNEIALQFTDNGPGIMHRMLPDLLFEPFATTKPKGSGIGLWQVRKLLQSLGGTITAENAPEGGARFTLRLPAGKPSR